MAASHARAGASETGDWRRRLYEQEVRLPGWHPDETTGGTRYWDGQRWAGDKRPPRRAFAAKSSYRGWGITLVIIGIFFLTITPSYFVDPPSNTESSPVEGFFVTLIIALALIAWGVYLLRGRGPSTKAVQAKLMQVQQVAGPMQPAPAPAPIVARDCTSCGAPISGPQGQVAPCPYCDSAQQF